MGGAARRRLFRGRLARRPDRRRFRRLLDYLRASIARTRAILLYVESINDARKFMSAARAAARVKPVVVVKSGRHAQGAKAARNPHRRARRLRRGLRRRVPPRRPAARARSRRVVRRGRDARAVASRSPASGLPSSPMAAASACWRSTGSSISAARSPASRRQTMARLDAALPPIWSRANPVDIAGDADASTLRGRARGAARRPGQRRRPGDERADRAGLADRRGKVGRRRRAAASQLGHSSQSRCSRSGSAAAARHPTPRRHSRPPAFPATRPNPTRSRASCISCATARRSTR